MNRLLRRHHEANALRKRRAREAAAAEREAELETWRFREREARRSGLAAGRQEMYHLIANRVVDLALKDMARDLATHLSAHARLFVHEHGGIQRASWDGEPTAAVSRNIADDSVEVRVSVPSLTIEGASVARRVDCRQIEIEGGP